MSHKLVMKWEKRSSTETDYLTIEKIELRATVRVCGCSICNPKRERLDKSLKELEKLLNELWEPFYD